MTVINPAWRKAVRVGLAEKNMGKMELATKAGLKSREYASAVMNGRVMSKSYAEAISEVLGIDVPYLAEVSEADIF